ncbi:MAG: DUF3006 domain-containing protein [Porcipelethomonas sp.]
MLILERFEGNTAVIENGGEHIETDRKNIPRNAKEGDVLVMTDGVYEIDRKQTEERRSRILKLQNSLWE